MADPLVSVLLPVRNGATTLPAALRSLLAQTHPDFEIIAVDDGSNDATPEVLAGLAAATPRLRILTRAPEGLCAALNAGLAAARGRFVARLDADDVCHPERLAAQAAMLTARPELGLVGCLVEFGGDAGACAGYAHFVAWQNGLTEPGEIGLARFVESPLAHPSVMFRAGLPARFGAYRHGPFPEDYELWLRWLEAGVVMAKVPRVLLTWNDPPGRLSRTDPRYAPEAFYRVKAGYLARWLAANNPHHPEIWVVGAGRLTRKRADLLAEHGVRIAGYVDLDPRKVGRTVHGRPVIHRLALPGPGERFLVSFVASRGARDEIEAFLTGRGHVPGRDFILAA